LLQYAIPAKQAVLQTALSVCGLKTTIATAVKHNKKLHQ